MQESVSAGKSPLSALFVYAGLALASLLANPAVAQNAGVNPGNENGAFLACAQYSDRTQRVACLETALAAAMAAQAAPGASAQSSATPATNTPAPVASMAPAVPTAPAAPQAAAAAPPTPVAAAAPASAAVTTTTSEEPSLLERLGKFGREEKVRVSTDLEGQDQLHDTITQLEKHNNLWTVTLSSGQVWKQEVARNLNLREGDEITIYQDGFGSGYRLATKRLSGFIRVERLK